MNVWKTLPVIQMLTVLTPMAHTPVLVCLDSLVMERNFVWVGNLFYYTIIGTRVEHILVQ